MENNKFDHEKAPQLVRWTRDGLLTFRWRPIDEFDKLIFPADLRAKISRHLNLFSRGEISYHDLKLPWRSGFFLYGPPGSGKTAASMAMAHRLQWCHLTIPAHEILDAHLFERAMAEVVTESHRVIVLEDVDVIIRSMEPEVFLRLLDHAMERADGTIWIANSRHPETVPKTQLVRPGRFEESIRMESPSAEIRIQLLRGIFEQMGLTFPEAPLPEIDSVSILDPWIEDSSQLTYAHFEELRQIMGRWKLDLLEFPEASPEQAVERVKAYFEDQLISRDRWGGLSDQTEHLQQRVQQVDGRLLLAALDMTDVFRRLMEKVIGDAAEKSKLNSQGTEI